jgi:hypothetical protein
MVLNYINFKCGIYVNYWSSCEGVRNRFPQWMQGSVLSFTSWKWTHPSSRKADRYPSNICAFISMSIRQSSQPLICPTIPLWVNRSGSSSWNWHKGPNQGCLSYAPSLSQYSNRVAQHKHWYLEFASHRVTCF